MKIIMSIQRLPLSENDIESGTSFLRQFSVNETHPLHSHDFYEMFLISKGKAIHNINGENQMLTKGSFVLIRPNDKHKYDFFNHFDFEIISIGIPISEFEDACTWLNVSLETMTLPNLPAHILLDAYSLADVERKLLHIKREECGVDRKQYFLSILPLLLYKFIYEHEGEQPGSLLPIWLTELIEKMNEPENFIVGLPRLLEFSNCSHEHLTREFRKHLGITPTEFINTKRMNHAAELLLGRKHEILDICYLSGFNNPSHFYHIFKSIYHFSPRQFVESFSEK
jgi:AraC family cel operon transcriptional repressor